MKKKKQNKTMATHKKKPVHLTEEEEKPAQWIEKDVKTESSGRAQIEKQAQLIEEVVTRKTEVVHRKESLTSR